MEIELVPDPGPEDAAARAALAALEEEGLAREPRPAGLDAPWRLAGLEHALDRDIGAPAIRGVVPGSGQRG